MNTKQKLLDILKEQLQDVSEGALAKLMLDLYEQKVREVEKLRQESAFERDQLSKDHEFIKSEVKRMRTEPLYCTAGEYDFILSTGKLVRVFVQGYKMQLMEELSVADMWAEARPVLGKDK